MTSKGQLSSSTASKGLSTVIPWTQHRPARGFAGRTVDPGAADYDALRLVANGAVDRRPALILRPRTAADVALAIAHARQSGLPLAVRSGGHSGAGHSTTDGGIVIDLRDMKALEIDEAANAVWAEAGLTAGEVTETLTGRGLVVGFGDAPTVGISGITLGGGVGYLVRKHGLTIDSLLAAEIVTADGAVRTVDADHEPELFWAIRGGGGNFGIVTRLRYRLNPLPAFTGGLLVLPATAATVSGFVAAAEAAPEELSTIAMVMPAPPMPFLAPELHGSMILMGMMAFAGDDEAARTALAPFRALATPLADMVKPGPFMQMYPPEDPDYRPKAAVRTFYADTLEAGTAGAIIDTVGNGTAPMRGVQLRVLGGAAARVPAEATAYAHRQRRLMGVAVAFVGDDAADRERQERWVADLANRVAGATPGAYVNFLADEGEARIREAYPGGTYERLQAVKRRYDPGNLFRLNQNIPPAP